jgi:hypothetical protein
MGFEEIRKIALEMNTLDCQGMSDHNEQMICEEIRNRDSGLCSVRVEQGPPSSAENLTPGVVRASVDAMATATDERLTWEQICERYPEQWVVLIDHERLAHGGAGFKTARVLAVGSSRAEAKERARPQLDSIYSWGCNFTGPIRGPRFGYRPWFIP